MLTTERPAIPERGVIPPGYSIGVLLAVLLGLLFCLVLTPLPINHDAALLLQCAQLLAQGSMPYVGHVELNPPMAQYLHLLPVLAARVAAIPLPMAFQLTVTLLVFGSAILLAFVLRSSGTGGLTGEDLLTVSLWVLFSLGVYASGSYGQREHLFVLCFVPWLFCREARYREIEPSPVVSLLIGGLTGLTALLKPHFLLIVVVTEAWLLLRTKRRAVFFSPESWLVWGLAAGYALHLLFVPTPMRTAFFTRWMPFILDHYRVYDNPWQRVLFLDSFARALILLFILGPAGAVFLLKRRASPSRHLLMEIMAISAVAAFGMYALQHKGWFYQLLPSLGILCMLYTVSFIAVIGKKRYLLYPAAGAGMVVLLLLFLRISSKLSDVDNPLPLLTAFMEETTMPSDRVTFISTNVSPAYPALVYADRLPGTRYPVAFPIAMFYDGETSAAKGPACYHTRGNASPEERQFLEELGSDIAVTKPRLLFIDTVDCQGCPDRFSVDTYLAYVGWKETYLWGYEELPRIGQFSVYRRWYAEDEERQYAALFGGRLK